MKIRSKTAAMVAGTQLVPGERDYPLDHEDPMTAFQLKTLAEIGLIEFDEILSDDLIKATEDALNEGRLDIDVTKVKDAQGKIVEIVYHGSTIKAKDAREPVKKSKKSRKNRN